MPQDGREELANVLSHGMGIIFGLIMLPQLPNELAFILYKFGFIFIFSASTLYHATQNPARKRLLQKIDHIAIYFMIAGSYSPFVVRCLPVKQAVIFLSIMWAIVLLGTIFKLFAAGKMEKVSLILYLSMGWMVLFIIKPFWVAFDQEIKLLVIMGGLLYSGGVYFYANDQKKFYHFIWHLFVLAGALCHFFAIMNIMK